MRQLFNTVAKLLRRAKFPSSCTGKSQMKRASAPKGFRDNDVARDDAKPLDIRCNAAKVAGEMECVAFTLGHGKKPYVQGQLGFALAQPRTNWSLNTNTSERYRVPSLENLQCYHLKSRCLYPRKKIRMSGLLSHPRIRTQFCSKSDLKNFPGRPVNAMVSRGHEPEVGRA